MKGTAMANWYARIEKYDDENGAVVQYRDYMGEVWEVVRWLTDQAKQLKKEPYMAPRVEGETPLDLEGLT